MCQAGKVAPAQRTADSMEPPSCQPPAEAAATPRPSGAEGCCGDTKDAASAPRGEVRTAAPLKSCCVNRAAVAPEPTRGRRGSVFTRRKSITPESVTDLNMAAAAQRMRTIAHANETARPRRGSLAALCFPPAPSWSPPKAHRKHRQHPKRREPLRNWLRFVGGHSLRVRSSSRVQAHSSLSSLKRNRNSAQILDAMSRRHSGGHGHSPVRQRCPSSPQRPRTPGAARAGRVHMSLS